MALRTSIENHMFRALFVGHLEVVSFIGSLPSFTDDLFWAYHANHKVRFHAVPTEYMQTSRRVSNFKWEFQTGKERKIAWHRATSKENENRHFQWKIKWSTMGKEVLECDDGEYNGRNLPMLSALLLLLCSTGLAPVNYKRLARLSKGW